MKTTIPLHIRLKPLLQNWVWLVWLAVLPIIWLLQPQDRQANVILGVVRADAETVGPIESVRIRALPIRIGQSILPGNILAEVEGFAMEQTHMDEIDYTVRLLGIQTNNKQEEQNIFISEMRTRQLIQEACVAYEECKLNQARDHATIKGFQDEYDRLQPLVKKGLLVETELTRLRPQITALEETLKKYPALLSALQTRLTALNADLTVLEHKKTAINASNQSEQVNLLNNLTNTLASQKSRILYLRATTTGIVSRIQFAVGDVVPTGVPIVRILSTPAMTIDGLLRPYQARLFQTNMLVTVISTSGPLNEHYPARIVQLEPEVLDLSDPFVPISSVRFPTRGRRVKVQLSTPNHNLIPGESVIITMPPQSLIQHLSHQWSVLTAQAKALTSSRD